MTETPLPAPRSRSMTAPLLLLVAVGFLELILLLSALVTGVDSQDIPVLLLALITLLVGAGPVLFNMVQPPEKRQILITVITAVYVIYLAVPVFTQYFFLEAEDVRGSFHLASYHPGDVAHAQAVALLGLAMLLVGFYLPFGRLAASVFPRPTREWPPHAVLVVGLLTLALGWLVYVPGQLGLIPARAGKGALGAIASGSSFGVALLTLAWLRHRRPEVSLLLAIVIPLTMFFNFFTGSKRMFLTPPFMFALAYVVYERRIRMAWLAAGFAALIVLYPVANFYRMVVNPIRGSRIALFVQDPGQFLAALSNVKESVDTDSYLSAGLQAAGNRLDGLGILTAIVRDTPERVPYQGGWTIGYIALSYIPRIIWANKPATTYGQWVSQSYGNPSDLETHVGPTWIGELFFNWGYAGVMLGMFVVGLLCRLLQERLFGWNAPIPALFGAVVVLYAVGRSVQGGLIKPVNGTVFNLAPILAAHYLVGLFSGYQRSSVRAPAPGTRSDLSPAPTRLAH